MSTIITRKDAKLLGLTKYFTGKECINGHLAERYVQSGTCSQCINGNASPARHQNSKTLLSLADNLEMTALSDFNTNLQRITRIYDKSMDEAKELRIKASENAQIEAESVSKEVLSDEFKAELRRLITVWVEYKPETRDQQEQYYLSLLQSRNPDFTVKHLRYRNRVRGTYFEIRCYPEDVNEILAPQVVYAKPQS